MAKPSYLPDEVTTYWDPDKGAVVTPPFYGEILQVAGAQWVQIDSHQAVSGNQVWVDAPPGIIIIPKAEDSMLCIDFYSGMYYGLANALESELLYRTAPSKESTEWSSWTNIVTSTKGTYAYTGDQEAGALNTFRGTDGTAGYYGLTYHAVSWTPYLARYWWDHNQTLGTKIQLKTRHRNTSLNVTNYIAHYGIPTNYRVEEIGLLPDGS